MATHDHAWRGSLSETPRAMAVKRHLRSEGVTVEKIGVVDHNRPENARYPFITGERARYVTVFEAEHDSEDMTPGEFSAYVSACNRLVNTNPENRFADDDETRVAVGYDYIDREIMPQQQSQSPAEAGKNLDDPREKPVHVFHHGGNRFTVLQEHTGEDQSDRAFRVDMDKPRETGEPVEPLFEGQPQPDAEEARMAIGAVVRAGPEYREGPQEQLNVTVGSPAGGNEQATTSSDDTGGSDTDPSNVDVVADPGADHDFDGEQLEANVEEWLSNYASVKDLLDGAWSVEFAQVTNPSNGNSELGVLIESDPWHGPPSVWDHDNRQWATDDGSQPDEWADHQAAMREIFQSDSDPVKGFSVEDPDSEYDDWYNYVPADDAENLP